MAKRTSHSNKVSAASLRRTTASAMRNYTALSSAADRYAVVEAAHRSIERRAMLRAISPDAVGVGAGCRRVRLGGGRLQYQADQPALVVYVPYKQHSTKVKPDRLVPKALAIRVSVKGKSRVYAVPTDVRRQPSPAHAHAVPSRVMVTTDPNNGLGTQGSLCARVRVNGGDLHALTCHHVAWCSEERPNLAADPTADNWSEDAGNVLGLHLGKPAYASDFAPGGQDCLDAALINLDPGGPGATATFWPASIKSVTTDRASLLVKWAQGAALYSRYFPTGVFLNPPTSRLSYPVGYDCGATATITELLEYSCLDSHPQAGDSGGAIVASDGTLLAMHTAGEVADGLGYAQPAYLLFSNSTFGVSISLG